MSDPTSDARIWANGLEDGIAPDQHLAVLPVSNLRLLIADLRRLADERDELLAALERMTEILSAFVAYYEIPKNHPDAELILTECRKAFALAERVRATATEPIKP